MLGALCIVYKVVSLLGIYIHFKRVMQKDIFRQFLTALALYCRYIVLNLIDKPVTVSFWYKEGEIIEINECQKIKINLYNAPLAHIFVCTLKYK